MAIELFFDCGAPSLYNKLSRKGGTQHIMGSHLKNRRRDDFSYVDTPEYKAYRREYAEFLLQEKGNLTVYSNLDVINNAELTYKNQKWLEKRGLTPLPVWHFGSDLKWLTRYLNEGYSYLCFGGMVPNPTAVLRPALDRIWRELLCDRQGMPKVKVHGFAMTSFDLMYRYPWYSVDSKSWVDYARFGFILVPPHKRDGSLDWLHPVRIGISNRSIDKRQPHTHYRMMSTSTRRAVHEYLTSIDVPLGKSELRPEPFGYELQDGETWADEPSDRRPGQVEVVIEHGVRNDYVFRMDANLVLYTKIEETAPQWPWSIDRTLGKIEKGLLI